jgi:hypothetical protein
MMARKKSGLLHDARYYAAAINAEWRKSVEGILEVGKLLIQAKKQCEYGEFLRLFKGHEDAVSEPVPFCRESAFKLIAVAEHEVLANVAHVQHLPQSWGTLYELAKLEGQQIIAGIKAGEITPDMTRAEASSLRADPIDKPDRELCVVVAEAFRSVYAKYSQKLDGDSRSYVIERLETLLELLKQEGSEDGSRRAGAKSTRTKAAAG